MKTYFIYFLMLSTFTSCSLESAHHVPVAFEEMARTLPSQPTWDNRAAHAHKEGFGLMNQMDFPEAGLRHFRPGVRHTVRLIVWPGHPGVLDLRFMAPEGVKVHFGELTRKVQVENSNPVQFFWIVEVSSPGLTVSSSVRMEHEQGQSALVLGTLSPRERSLHQRLPQISVTPTDLSPFLVPKK